MVATHVHGCVVYGCGHAHVGGVVTQIASGLESRILLTSALRASSPEKLEERARVSRNVSGCPRTHPLFVVPLLCGLACLISVASPQISKCIKVHSWASSSWGLTNSGQDFEIIGITWVIPRKLRSMAILNENANYLLSPNLSPWQEFPTALALPSRPWCPREAQDVPSTPMVFNHPFADWARSARNLLPVREIV